jgi:hypothetical protein
LTSPTMFLYIGLFILYALSCQKPNPIFLWLNYGLEIRESHIRVSIK